MVITKDESKREKKSEKLRTNGVAFVDVCVVLETRLEKKIDLGS